MRNIVCLALHSTQFRSLMFPPMQKGFRVTSEAF